jgi:hypothetical protein
MLIYTEAKAIAIELFRCTFDVFLPPNPGSVPRKTRAQIFESGGGLPPAVCQHDVAPLAKVPSVPLTAHSLEVVLHLAELRHDVDGIVRTCRLEDLGVLQPTSLAYGQEGQGISYSL